MVDSTQPNNAFDQLQVGKLVYLDNYYRDPQGSTIDVSWEIPCGQQLGFNCYTDPSPFEVDGSEFCKLTYNVQQEVGNTQFVRMYPSWLLGTLGGRDSSHGVGAKVGCNTTGILAPSGRCGNSAVYDMRDVKAATGFPIKPADLPQTSICYRNSICEGSTLAVRNTFDDAYIHYIADPSLWPSGYNSAWGDENKINARATATWNINTWRQWPNYGSGINWTGGTVFTNITLGGRNFDVYCKHENRPNAWNAGCGAGFFYIGFRPTSPVIAGELDCLDFSAQLAWVSSIDFKNRVLGDPACLQIWNDLGQPPFIVDEPNNFLLAGLQGGNEVWFSQENEPTVECWSDLSIKVGNETYGKVQPINNKQVPIDPDRPWTAGDQVQVGDIILVASGPNTVIVQP